MQTSVTSHSNNKCDVCGKTFTRHTHLIEHERTHTGEKPYKCQFCPKTFAQSGAKTRHERIHTEKSYQCGNCSMTFYDHHQLKVHKMRSHFKIQPFKCEICGKGFYFKCDLNSHNEKVHTKEFTLPLECNYCKKLSRSLGALSNHTIFCQARPDLIENGRREEEAFLFVEPSLNDFPDDGEDEVGFNDTSKDPLEL